MEARTPREENQSGAFTVWTISNLMKYVIPISIPKMFLGSFGGRLVPFIEFEQYFRDAPYTFPFKSGFGKRAPRVGSGAAGGSAIWRGGQLCAAAAGLSARRRGRPPRPIPLRLSAADTATKSRRRPRPRPRSQGERARPHTVTATAPAREADPVPTPTTPTTPASFTCLCWQRSSARLTLGF